MANANILIVEDEDLVALKIQKMVKRLGYDASTIACSGEEAVRKAEEIQPDLVIMDIVLKGEMDGIEAATKIRTHFDIPVIYITGYTDDEKIDRAKFTEPFGYIVKPFKDRELYSTIEIALYKHKVENAEKERIKRISQQTAAMLELSREDLSDLDSALKKITVVDAKTLEVERVNIWIFNEDRSEIECIQHYERSKNKHEKGAKLSIEQYPSYFKALEQSRFIAADNARTDPRTHEFKDDYLSPLVITSMMDAPIRMHGKTIGVICHEHVGPMRKWELAEQDFAGSMADMVAIAFEASERKRTEEALKESEERFRTIFDNVKDAIFVETLDGWILDANKAAYDMLGYTREELTSKRVGDIVPAEKAALLPEMIQAKTVKEGVYIETEELRKNGERIPVDISNTLVEIGGEKRIVAIVRDISERMKAEEELKRTRDELESTAGGLKRAKELIGLQSRELDEKSKELLQIRENSNEEKRILLIDDERDILSSLSKFLSSKGYDVEITRDSKQALSLIQDKSFAAIVSDLRMPDINGVALLEKVLAVDPDIVFIIMTGYASAQSAVDALKKGAYDYMVKPFSLHDLEKTLRLGLDRRKLAMENVELFKLTKKLIKIDAIKSNVINTISHEFRNPLASVREANAQLIDGLKGPLNNGQDRLLKISQRNVNRLTRITDNILNLARLESGKVTLERQFVDISSLARQSIDSLRSQANQKRIKLCDKIPHSLPMVFVDPGMIRQVFTNLVNNAIKYTGEGGTVTLRAKIRKDVLEASVIDTGIGIPTTYLDKIFNPFERAPNVPDSGEGGVGLGLTICKEIVLTHKGKIWVAGKVGKGSAFTFTLPLTKKGG